MSRPSLVAFYTTNESLVIYFEQLAVPVIPQHDVSGPLCQMPLPLLARRQDVRYDRDWI